jgi:thiol-disulfide isomerase/thioredoxin
MKKTLLILAGSLFSLVTFAQSQRSLNTFSKVSFAEKSFTLTGTFKGYNPAVDSFKYCSVIYNHLYKHDQQTHTGEIDKTGKFSIVFPLNRPQEIMFEFGDELIVLYAIPGSSLSISLDLPAFKVLARLPYEEHVRKEEPVIYSGQYAQLNTEFRLFKPIINNALHYKEHYALIDSLDQIAYKTWRMVMMQRLQDSLAAFNNRYNTSTEFRQLMTQHIRYGAAEDLLRYRWLHNSKTKKRELVNLTPEYLNFLADMPADNEEAVITEKYSSFLEEYINFYRPHKAYKIDQPAFIAYLKNHNKSVSPVEEQLLTTTETQPSPERFQQIDAVYKKYRSEMTDFMQEEMLADAIDTVGTSISPGIGRDILFAHILAAHLNNNRIPLTETQLTTLVGKIDNSNLRNQIRQDNDRLKNVLAGNMPATSHIRSGLQVSEDKFFAELIKPYKGKVVYIDFWAPWCGPCMGEMPASKELQKELTGKEVVFLYIAVRCTKQSWENTIKEKKLEGEHYFANENEGKLLSGKFNIAGIPHYVLIDKEGEAKDDDALRPSDKTKLLKRINELLKK